MSMEKGENVADSYLSRMIKAANYGTKRNLVNAMGGFLFASVDTTSTVMTWFLIQLAQNPDKQRLLREELKTLLNDGDYNKEVRLPYLKACEREAHRYYFSLKHIHR